MGIKFDNQFEIPAAIDDAWAILLDVARVAPCMPGASLERVIDEDHFEGAVSVRLGPIELSFRGKAEILERDKTAHHVKFKGMGAEQRGRGQASALFDVQLTPLDAQTTRVDIASDVTLVGSVAQYGRGVAMMKAVSEEIVARFTDNLRAEIGTARGTPSPTTRTGTSLSIFALLRGMLLRWWRARRAA